MFDELGLIGWPKTSGNRGINIYARIEPLWDYFQVRRAGLAIAREVERRHELATTAWWKEERDGVFLDFSDAIGRLGRDAISERYGNLFAMYEKITGENPYERPMRIYPAPHYTMGGLWVDYRLMSTIPGLFVLGEANFSDHGANRLGASALMQGLADGYFVIPYTIGNYLASAKLDPVDTGHAAFRDAEKAVQENSRRLLDINGSRTVDSFHKALGRIMWEKCGMARDKAGL